MPHVVLEGDMSLDEVFRDMEPVFLKEEDTLLKTAARYIESTGASILVECLTVEKGVKTSFMILLSRRQDGLVVRMHPLSEVEKTPAVKRVLAETAKGIMARHPGLNVGKTNLREFI